MKEIGGYFELEISNASSLNFIHSEGALLNSGKNALEYILRNIIEQSGFINVLWIPSYSCNTILEPIEKLRISYKFYHVDKNLHIPDIIIGENDYIVYTNYFGIMDVYIRNLYKYIGKHLIVDNAQSFGTKLINGCKTIYSPRKCYGVPDGGIAFPNNGTDMYEQDFSFSRFNHLLKRCELRAIEGYEDFKKNGMNLRGQPIRKMSLLTTKILNSIDYEKSIIKRKKNFYYLHDFLSSTNIITPIIDSLNTDAYPSFYPYYTENNNIRNLLIKENVFVATYWPNVLESNNEWQEGNEIEKKWVKNVIPLPIDHRYDLSDMERIIKIILG